MKKLLHNLFGWHFASSELCFEYDGCSVHSKCEICKKEIMMDSQGNWFTYKADRK